MGMEALDALLQKKIIIFYPCFIRAGDRWRYSTIDKRHGRALDAILQWEDAVGL